MRGLSTLKSVSRSRSLVGRVSVPRGVRRGRERNWPAMMRMQLRIACGGVHSRRDASVSRERGFRRGQSLGTTIWADAPILHSFRQIVWR